MFLIFAPAFEEEDGLHLKGLLVAIAHAIQLKAPSCSVPWCIFIGLPQLFISRCCCQYVQTLQVDHGRSNVKQGIPTHPAPLRICKLK